MAQSGDKIQFFGKPWLPQTCFCAFYTILGSLWVLGDLRMALPTQTKTPVLHFHLVAEILDCSLKLVTIKHFWASKAKILKLLDYIHFMEITWPSVQLKKEKYIFGARYDINKIKPLGLIFLYTAVGIINWGIGPGVNVYVVSDDYISQNEWSVRRWWLEMREWSQYIFFLEANVTSKPTNISAPFSETILGGLAALGYLQKRVLGLYTDLFVLVGAITLHEAVAAFKIRLEADVERTASEDIQDQLEALQKLARMINKQLGASISCLLAYIVAFYAISLDSMFVSQEEWRNVGKIIKVAFFYSNYVAILIVSADTSWKVNKYYLL